jgi:hypothetical protein
MDRKDCFGSLKEVSLNQSQTTTQARAECRTCEEIRDCLRYSKQLDEEEKERDELSKQNMIAQIIDHSHIISNEIGSCLLEFLNRLYSSPLGGALFKNLLLFHEISPNSISSNLSIPISRALRDLLQGGKTEPGVPSPSQVTPQRGGLDQGMAFRIILFQRSFPKNPMANMGMIASEVARTFASDDVAVKQIFQTLSDVERNLFKKMDIERQVNWLIGKWGFLEEYEALQKEMAAAKLKEQLDMSIKE